MFIEEIVLTTKELSFKHRKRKRGRKGGER